MKHLEGKKFRRVSGERKALTKITDFYKKKAFFNLGEDASLKLKKTSGVKEVFCKENLG